jgi:Mrp family chromosome partitioning ATPase
MNGPHFAPPPAAESVTLRPAALPRPAARPPARTEPAPGGSMIVTYLRLHWMTILFSGALLGAVLAYAAWTLLPSKYESYALLQVASTPSAIAPANDPNRGKTEFVTYLKTNAQLIKSEFVLNSALSDAKYRIADLPTLREQKDPIKYLDEKIVVQFSDGSEVIRVSLEGDRPDDVRKIVDAVKDAYYREVVEKEIAQKVWLKHKVEEAKTALEGQMRNKTGVPAPNLLAPSVMAASQPTPPVPNLTGAPGQTPITPATHVIPVPGSVPAAAAGAIVESDTVKRALFQLTVQKVAQLKTELEQFPVVIKEKADEVARLKKQLDGIKAGDPSPEALAAAERDPDVIIKVAVAAQARSDYDFKKNSRVNPNAPVIQDLRIAAEKAEAEAERVKVEKAKALDAARNRDLSNRLTYSLELAQQHLTQFQERERVTRQQLETAKKDLNETPLDIRAPEKKGPPVDPVLTDLMTHDSIYARLTAQLIGLELELQSPQRVRKLQDASAPSLKDSKKQILGTVAAGLLGFVLLGLGAVMFETRARKVCSLAELKTAGPTPVVGVIPWSPDGSTARDPVKRADAIEAIDKLRSHVAQAWLARGATTLAVTSPLGDEGKAFTAFGLANSLTLAGYKTLVIDFDLRNPSLHPFAGVPNSVGVCELLRGEVTPQQAVQAMPNGLCVLPAGQWSDEARLAAVGGRFEALLARLREPFDCVILHGHALLTVAESIEVARRADVVLLCTLYRETRLPLLKRAAERLATMEVAHSGVVYLGATPNETLC